METPRKYQPSNGTEGVMFTSKFCENCIHEQAMQSPDQTGKCCEIFTKTLVHSPSDSEYPGEWIYDAEGNGTCTAFQEFHWKKDESGEWIQPEIKDPNQISLF